MEFSADNNFSSYDILNKVLDSCDDRSLRSGYTEGWYHAMIEEGLREIGFDSKYKEVVKDIKNWNDGSNQINVPENIFNVKHLYLFNGDCCILDKAIRVDYKRNFNNTRAKDYTANIMHGDRTGDVFYPHNFRDAPKIPFGNIQNGKIMIFSKSDNYPHLRVIGNGIESGDVRDDKIIPQFAVNAINDYVACNYWRSMIPRHQNPGLANDMYVIFKNSLEGNRMVAGSWDKAISRLKSIGRWKRDNISLHTRRPDF